MNGKMRFHAKARRRAMRAAKFLAKMRKTLGEAYSQIIHASSLLLDSQISTFARLISVTHRDDIQPSLLNRGRQPVALVGGVGSGA
jgi:hypothetical protein